MKPLSYGLFLVLFFAACHQAPSSSSIADDGISDSLAQKAKGVYMGNFSKSLITVGINYISGRIVSGYDIHKGLRRNINGVVSRQGSLLNFVLAEPGDNPYDGTFSFSMDTLSWKINGKWTARDTTKLPVRTLALSRNIVTENTIYGEMYVAGRDSTLTLQPDGTCSFAFYERPDDSTSQVITINGNYSVNGKEYRIEWQKNSHFPSMTLMLEPAKFNADSSMATAPVLRGHGISFEHFMGD